ncbi:zinc ABC transporter substrate-binding protein [bacterium]|nr:zinc ABC transporter substrate-binding protein [bacterium]
MKKLLAIVACFLFTVSLLPVTVSAASGSRSVVVSTSMLEAAAREVIPGSAPVEVVSILPPSSCPGHFDLSPRVIPLLKGAAMVIRHDYQSILDEKIARLGGEVRGMNIIETTGSPLIPEHYFRLTEHVAELLVTLLPDRAPEINASLEGVGARTEKLGAEARKTAEQWHGAPVIAATNAVELCTWLGFDVVGVLKRPEDTTPQDFEKLIGLDAVFIVGNYQEGTQSALSLGEKMKAPVAVISNFPGAEGYGKTYEELFSENLRRIQAAWQKR